MKLLFALALVLFLTGCSSVPLPLGVHVNHPKPMKGPVGVRLATGWGTAPEVAGVVSEIKDIDGQTFNKIPKDSGDANFIYAYPNIDLALGLAGYVDIGISSYRGYYLIGQLFEAGPLTFSLSPAYQNYTSETGDKKAEGKLRNTNLTGIACFDLFPSSRTSIYAYGGYGKNFYKAWQKTLDPDNGNIINAAEKKTSSPTYLIGFGAQLFVVQGNAEFAFTRIPQSDGRNDWVKSVQATISMGFF